MSEYSDHHGVPRSYGGTRPRNISKLLDQEHQHFHASTGHIPPAFVMERFLVAQSTWPPGCLPVNATKDCFDVLDQRSTWRNLYHDECVNLTSAVSSDEERRNAKVAYHLAQYLSDARQEIRNAIATLGGRQDVSHSTMNFTMGMFSIMAGGVHAKPDKVLSEFLRQKNNQGHYKWTKPLRAWTRKKLLGILGRSRPRKMTNGTRAKMIDALVEREHLLAEREQHWEPGYDVFVSYAKTHPDAIAKWEEHNGGL